MDELNKQNSMTGNSLFANRGAQNERKNPSKINISLKKQQNAENEKAVRKGLQELGESTTSWIQEMPSK